MHEASLLINRGELANVLKLINKSIQAIKNADEKISYLSKSAFLLRDLSPDQALQFSLEATKHKNSSAYDWYVLSIIEFKKRNKKNASVAALKSLEKNPTPQELVDIGRHLSDLGEDRA